MSTAEKPYNMHEAIATGELKFDLDTATQILTLARKVATQVAQGGTLEWNCYEAFCYASYTMETCLRNPSTSKEKWGKFGRVLTVEELELLEQRKASTCSACTVCEHEWAMHIVDGGGCYLTCRVEGCNCQDFS